MQLNQIWTFWLIVKIIYIKVQIPDVVESFISGGVIKEFNGNGM